MARQKNLLEAFKSASQVESQTPSSGSGPFAGSSERKTAPKAPKSSGPSSRPQASGPGALERGLAKVMDWRQEPTALPLWMPLVVGAVAFFALGFWLGRTSSGGGPADEVQAAANDEEPRRDPAGLVPARGADLPGGGSTLGTDFEDSALFDPDKRYAVVVSTYGQTASSLAWATYDHLVDEQMPVFPPLEVGDKIVVMAGAAVEYDDLSDLEGRIQALSRDGRPGVYEDAYRVKIDTLIRRD